MIYHISKSLSVCMPLNVYKYTKKFQLFKTFFILLNFFLYDPILRLSHIKYQYYIIKLNFRSQITLCKLNFTMKKFIKIPLGDKKSFCDKL